MQSVHTCDGTQGAKPAGERHGVGRLYNDRRAAEDCCASCMLPPHAAANATLGRSSHLDALLALVRSQCENTARNRTGDGVERVDEVDGAQGVLDVEAAMEGGTVEVLALRGRCMNCSLKGTFAARGAGARSRLAAATPYGRPSAVGEEAWLDASLNCGVAGRGRWGKLLIKLGEHGTRRGWSGGWGDTWQKSRVEGATPERGGGGTDGQAGLLWEQVGEQVAATGAVLCHASLAQALEKKLRRGKRTVTLTRDEVEQLGVAASLSYDSYIKVGDAYFRPARQAGGTRGAAGEAARCWPAMAPAIVLGRHAAPHQGSGARATGLGKARSQLRCAHHRLVAPYLPIPLCAHCCCERC